MSDIKLFKIQPTVIEKKSSNVMLEKELQNIIENNMELFFRVRFLDTEYVIPEGRIDSLGIDENNCPVIFEYKRSINENVINQGLFYLDWLMDHQAEFQLLVMKKLGNEIAEMIDWSAPSVTCVAGDFTKYDIHAVNQMGRNIKLVKYQKYDEDYLLFEYLNAPKVKATIINDDSLNIKNNNRTFLYRLESTKVRDLYIDVCNYIESLGDDISSNQLKYYLAYKKVGNFVCIEVFQNHVILRLKLDPLTVEMEEGFIRNTRNIGTFGTGDVEVTIRNVEDFEKAKSLVDRAYLEG